MKLSFFLTFLAGGLLFFHITAADAETFCVDPGGGGTHTSLQEVLDAAAANSQDDLIQVTEGTYNGNFLYVSNQGFGITIKGGYKPGCGVRGSDPDKTIIDGGGADRALFVDAQGGGNVVVDGFTIKNGAQPANGCGGGLCAVSRATSGAAGNILISNNIVYGSISSMHGGGIYAASITHAGMGAAGDVTIVNNIVSGNRSGRGGGIYTISSSVNAGSGMIKLTNNTACANRASGKGGGIYAYIYSGSFEGEKIEIFNNIARANEASDQGADIYVSNSGYMAKVCYNNYVNIDASHMNNVTFEQNIKNPPGFVSPGSWDDSGTAEDPSDDIWISGDYHLQLGSACIDAGLLEVKGYTLAGGPYHFFIGPQIDFEGDARFDQWHAVSENLSHKYCDLGADEYKPSAMPWLLLFLMDE